MRLTLYAALTLAIMVLSSVNARAADWQFSVPMNPGYLRRAYLWVPPNCHHVRGVILGLQNMLERPLMLDPTIRKACAENNLGEVWIAPGAVGGKDAPDLLFKNPKRDYAALQKIMARLAKRSGYPEIKYAPMLVVGHSAAAPFVWGMASKYPKRVFAVILYKSWYLWRPLNVPFLDVTSEWGEWGKNWGGDGLSYGGRQVIRLRTGYPNCLMGEFSDVGSGHFDFTHSSAAILAIFIHEAVQARLPRNEPLDAPVKLKIVNPKSGYLVARKTLGRPDFKSVAYRDWKGNPTKAYWYFSRRLADSINAYMLKRNEKRPQAIDFLIHGKPAPLITNGFASLSPHYLSNGSTFVVHATWLNKPPTSRLYPGVTTLGHAPTPILFRTVPSGAIKQVGSNEFKIALHAGGFKRLGPPWEPWVLAYNEGNREYRRTDRPAHVWIPIRNTVGEQQTLAFDPIPDPKPGTRSITLHATASSGLPVQFYVISGPVNRHGNTLTFSRIPVKSKFPLRVVIGAYQWGRATAPKVQSAGPLLQRFNINARGDAVAVP